MAAVHSKQPRDELALNVLEAALEINEHGLEDALLSQPDAYYRVAKALALESSRRDAAKQSLAEVEAKAETAIRKAAIMDEYKITVAEVESERRLQPSVKQAQEQLLKLNANVALLTALKEAFTQRSYVLKSLVELYISNYYGSDIDNRASRDMREVVARRAKEAMAKERQDLRSTRR